MMIETKTKTVIRVTDHMEDVSVTYAAISQANKRGLEGYKLVNATCGSENFSVDLTFEKVEE